MTKILKINGMYKVIDSFKFQNAKAKTLLKCKWVKCVTNKSITS